MWTLRHLEAADQAAVEAWILRQWHATTVVAHGTIYAPATLPGLVVEFDGAWVGLATYHLTADACELITIDSLNEGQGIGTALIEAVIEIAKRAACRRVWLITTNDNLHALRFYQRRGFHLVAIHRFAVDAARKLKPSIPLIGNDGIPLRDEIELEYPLEPLIQP